MSNLNNPELTTILFAILVKRLGGKVEITQADVDDIAYNRLQEEGFSDGSLQFTLIERPKRIEPPYSVGSNDGLGPL